MIRNLEGIHSKVVLGCIFYKEFVNLFVNNYMHTAGGCDGLPLLHPGSFNILLGELDLKLSDVTLADGHVRQRLHQGHWTH